MVNATSDALLLDRQDFRSPAERQFPTAGRLHAEEFAAEIQNETTGGAPAARVAVGLCETQPIAVAGIRAVLSESSDLELSWACDSLATGQQLARTSPPNVLVIDKAFGMQAVLDTVAELGAMDSPVAVVVWGIALTEAEALRFLQAGARGIMRKTSDLSTLLAGIRRVGAGNSWMEDYVLRESTNGGRRARSSLTPREQQVLELVERGLKNKDIASALDIRPGTVKIHLKHIFEKTGVRGRYGLALASLKDRNGAQARGAA